ncbi:sterol desaturase family protein [Henriciella sp. AS95]|uniref:sterol desaturase family protein n=1 Tax=Henriciella sp. AS95 TaxID=3135782 RepID=UPI00317F9C65
MPSELIVRIGIFFVVFVTLVLLEAAMPKRPSPLARTERWPGAFGLFVIGAVAARLVVPVGLAGLAIWASSQGFGLFNLIDLPIWLVGLASLLLLDLAVWAQHVLMHHVPVLWRMHRVHHADPHIDVMTALRFHPAEILVSLAWKAAIVVAFGLPAWAAFTFEVALNAFAQFNHANWALPKPVDALLRKLVVTPDMHRVHHSVERAEANTNFGFCLSIWDRMFGVYKAQPDAGHDAMIIGQKDWRTAADQSPLALIRQPLERPGHSDA